MLRSLNLLTAILLLAAATAVAQAPPAKPAAQAPAKATPQAPPPKSAPPAKTAAQKPAATKSAPAKPAKTVEKPAQEAKKEEALPTASKRRDPFLQLVNVNAVAGAPVHLPPGIAGLQVSTLRVEGIVRSQNGMLVVVTNPQGRTYFLHKGDRVFDGRVDQVSMDGVTFTETGKDPFGKVIERQVVKRIYPSAGEQQ